MPKLARIHFCGLILMKRSCWEISNVSLRPVTQRAGSIHESRQALVCASPLRAPPASIPGKLLLFLLMRQCIPLCSTPALSPEKIATDHVRVDCGTSECQSPWRQAWQPVTAFFFFLLRSEWFITLCNRWLLFDKPCSPKMRLLRLLSLGKHTRVSHNCRTSSKMQGASVVAVTALNSGFPPVDHGQGVYSF